MNVEFRLPEIAENIESGDVGGVLVREGDLVAQNDCVIELETDKAVSAVPCPYAGKIVKIHVTKGQTIQVGQAVLSVETAESQETAAPAAALSAGLPARDTAQDAYGPVRREKMSAIRRTIATQMVRSATIIPHVTNFDDADVTELDRLRKTLSPADSEPLVRLSMLPFALKAVASALREHAALNASIDDENGEIVYKQYVNLGVAVDTPRGLVVPAIRNVDRMGVLEIARALSVLAARARSAEFAVDDLRGGTFTISNLGAVGGTYSTPIVNHPEVAILLLGRARPMLRTHEGKVEDRLMMPLSLSYDHRVVDGAAAGRFLNDVITFLQSPGTLLATE
jgi:pyruvate dehydrogenase E2 component (dihydrolipoamide acetyltransferase)